MLHEVYDICIIGSGFGGSIAAYSLTKKGYSVVLIESGEYVERNKSLNTTHDRSQHINTGTYIEKKNNSIKKKIKIANCVGGSSVFYGGVSLRFTESDFDYNYSINSDIGCKWPITYYQLQKYYQETEKLLDVHKFQHNNEINKNVSNCLDGHLNIADISKKIVNAGNNLGLTPFLLPLAINYKSGYRQCIMCNECDTFACNINAKNDLATVVIPKALNNNLILLTNTIARKLIYKNKKIINVEVISKKTKKVKNIYAKHFILSGGALSSPSLILNSSLELINPASKHIGRHLMKHINAINYGVYNIEPKYFTAFHKQVGFMDFYEKKLGMIQQASTPSKNMVSQLIPKSLSKLLSPFYTRMTGLLTICEDQSQFVNKISISKNCCDEFGIPFTYIKHKYSGNDYMRSKILNKHAKNLLKETKAIFSFTHHIKTFSHAIGTLRMGDNPNLSPVDKYGFFRGVINLSIADGSIFATSAAVNPSLTIAALSLYIADEIDKLGLK